MNFSVSLRELKTQDLTQKQIDSLCPVYNKVVAPPCQFLKGCQRCDKSQEAWQQKAKAA